MSSWDSARSVAGICSLGGHDELERLLLDAGFVDVAIERERRPAHFPPPALFVFQHLSGLPVAEAVEELSPDAKVALAADVTRRVAGYAGTAGLSIPFEIHCARALRAS